jgi:colanic acid biosynthesis glycosyl transferase WcaI
LSQLLFLNRSYWPDFEATGQLLTELCEHLSESFDVHVVCGQPNSALRQDFVREGTSLHNRVTIHRLQHTCFAKRIPAGRLLNLLSFSRAAAKYLRRSNLFPDVVISETDPFLLPIVAAKHAQRSGSKLACYLQDIYPDVAEAIGKVKPGFLTRQIRQRLKSSYQAADRIIVLGECMRARLQSPPWSLNPETLHVIPNWADCQTIRPVDRINNPFRKQEGLQDKFVVMHSGNMGLTQRLDVLIASTANAAWPKNAVLVLVGDGAAKRQLQQLAASLHPSDFNLPSSPVRFLPYQPRETLAESLSAADVHAVSMHENITGCLCPSKLYGILAAGRPVLAIASQETDLCQTVNRHGLGWCCKPGDVGGIAEAIATATAATNQPAMNAQARSIACQRFDRLIVMNQFTRFFNELVESNRSGTHSLASGAIA